MKQKEMRDMIRMVVTLFAIALICSAILGVVNAVTRDRIAEIKAEAQAAAMREVLPDGKTFTDCTDRLSAEFRAENDIQILYEATTASGEVAGYAVMTSPRGFKGAIEMIVGVSADRTVAGVVITASSETAGLGTKAQDPAFLANYIGKSGSLSVVKGTAGENEISAITGATVTTRAVTAGVQSALRAVNEVS